MRPGGMPRTGRGSSGGVTMTLPIIYVRGFGGGTSGIDRLVDDPFYGFNEGATHVRVGEDAEPHFYQFEGPLLRLLMDYQYRLFVYGDQEAFLDSPDPVDANSVWIHRFYDQAASTFGKKPQDFILEKAAENLFTLVQKVRRKTGAERVYLIAHSMGGLICRSMLQRVCPDQGVDAADYVESLFTYATPHGGIEFAVGSGLLEKLRDFVNVNGAEIFGPERMYHYLTPSAADGDHPPEGWRPAVMPDGGFPVQRVFCLIGTDASDYDAALGLSSKAVGARSDGLVTIDNAYVPGAHRAFVHRSHSGRYGIVNSEEGYQNLRRFLFGDLEVTASLTGLDVAGSPDDETVWQLDAALSIRGLPVVLHEQSAAHLCPIQIERRPVDDTVGTPVPLVRTYLSSDATRPTDATGARAATMRHVLRLRLLSLRRRGGL